MELFTELFSGFTAFITHLGAALVCWGYFCLSTSRSRRITKFS